MSTIVKVPERRRRPGDCSNKGHCHIAVLPQPEASHGSHLHCRPRHADLPRPRGCTHRPGADAVGVLAAVPVPAVHTPVYGVADVAVACVPGSTGTGDVHASLRALCVPGTPPVVLAAHVDHYRDKSVRLTETPCYVSWWSVCLSRRHPTDMAILDRAAQQVVTCCLAVLSAFSLAHHPRPSWLPPYLCTFSHLLRSVGCIRRGCRSGRWPEGGTVESRWAS